MLKLLRAQLRSTGGLAGRHVLNYGVLYGLAIGLVVFTAVVPTLAPKALSQGAAPNSPYGSGSVPGAVVSPGTAGLGSPPPGLTPGTGGAVPAGAVANPVTETEIARGLAPAYGTTVAGVNCRPGVRQVSMISYAPYCVPTYVGPNGGSTWHGVTDKAIYLCFREFNDQSTQAANSAADAVSGETQQQVENSIDTFVKFFNDHYDFYGRKIVLVRHTGHGSYSDETTGGGQDNARADAIECHDQDNGFAELEAGAESEVYTDQLRSLGVMSVAGPHYDPTRWYDSERPWVWNLTADCDFIVNVEANFIGRQVGTGNAVHAGDPTYQISPRKFGLLVPDLPSYGYCGDLLESLLWSRYHIKLTLRVNYQLNLATATQQTQNYVSQFKSAGVTSLVMLTDAFTPAFMTQQADKQQWYPEWLIAGISNTDVDLIGRAYQQDQWAHAFGPSTLTIKGESKATTDGNAAYTAETGSSSGYAYQSEGYFVALNAFANMVQMAGPDLTPSTMEQGYFYFPPTTGEIGLMYFGAHNHYNTHDMREVWWSTTATGVDGLPGHYVEVDNGKRWQPNNWPSGDSFFH